MRWHPGPGIIPIRRTFAPADVRRWAGLPITTPLATAHELARGLPLRDAVVWLDALTRVRHLSRANVLAHVAAHRCEQGWRLAHRAVSLCDPRAESPPESLVRLHLTLAGLPRPVPQHHVLHQGDFVARVDLAWPSVKLALEYDGQWHASPGQLGRDRRRIRQLNALGWYVYPVTSADLHHLDDLASTVAGLLSARGHEFKVKTRLSLE